MDIYDKITSLSKKCFDEVVSIYKDIHKHPELSNQEHRTSDIIYEKLKSLNMKVYKCKNSTGVIGVLKGGEKGKTIALRAEMDALPIKEKNDLEYKSINDGVMHACGHDIHISNLLGVAIILSKITDKIKGNVKFIFQPAEERGGGAKRMIDEDVLSNPKVDAMIGMHIAPENVGEIQVGFGNVLSASSGVNMEVTGKKSHTSTPQEGIDAILTAANIVTGLHTISSRNIDPFQVATFTLGTINGGKASNIIADKVVMKGIIRSLNDNMKNKFQEKIKLISEKTAEGFGSVATVKFSEGYPMVTNNMEVTRIFAEFVAKRFDEINFGFAIRQPFSFIEKPLLTSDDFGFFSKQIPSCYFFIGAGKKANWHKSDFIADENVFKVSLNMVSSFIINYLEQ